MTSTEMWGEHVAAWASHLEALAWAFTQTEGPVVEYGGGWYSTPMLHGLCEGAGRSLYTVESDELWADGLALRWADDNHLFTSSFTDEDLPEYPGLVFIDDAAWDRAPHIERSHDATLVVVHDSELVTIDNYPGMKAALDKYKYQKRWAKFSPAHTTVVSDIIEL